MKINFEADLSGETMILLSPWLSDDVEVRENISKRCVQMK